MRCVVKSRNSPESQVFSPRPYRNDFVCNYTARFMPLIHAPSTMPSRHSRDCSILIDCGLSFRCHISVCGTKLLDRIDFKHGWATKRNHNDSLCSILQVRLCMVQLWSQSHDGIMYMCVNSSYANENKCKLNAQSKIRILSPSISPSITVFSRPTDGASSFTQ